MLNYNVDLNMSQLFSNMNHVSTVTALRSRSVLDNTLDGEYTFYLHPVPELDANPVGVMVFVISNDTLQALLNECVPAGYELYVCSNQYLNWLFRSDLNANTTTLFEYMNRMNSTGVFHANIDGSSYLLLRDGSEHDSVYHMLAYDSSKLYDGIIAERNPLLVSPASGGYTGGVSSILAAQIHVFSNRSAAAPPPTSSRRKRTASRHGWTVG